ncbi:hypothetical protein FBUS_07774 [Fasciolopsis buskii]|uniref:Uncharacterized protein n=1 Tax=Fasciolopsis buskii TaxID=27845 RepID=A0A8E0S4V7_9TREM|nr:hypothetical protein FBUS_07774 [Fasciolopsis buski]
MVTQSRGILMKEQLSSKLSCKIYVKQATVLFYSGAERERPEVESQMRRPGESELDFYERRYQEREKAKYIRRPPPIRKP